MLTEAHFQRVFKEKHGFKKSLPKPSIPLLV